MSSSDRQEIRLFIYGLVFLTCTAMAFRFGVQLDFAGAKFRAGLTDVQEVVQNEDPEEQIGNPTQPIRGSSEPASHAASIPNGP